MGPILVENNERITDIKCSVQQVESSKGCGAMPLAPMGTELVAELGSYYKLYCSPPMDDDQLMWTFPNGSQLEGNRSEVGVIWMCSSPQSIPHNL